MAEFQTDDLYKTGRHYQRQLKYIKEEWKISEEDKRIVLDFLNTTELQSVGVVQRIKYLFGIKSFNEFFQSPLESCKTENLKEWLSFLNSKYKQKTVSTRWYALKRFYNHIGKEDLYAKLKIKFRTKGMKLPEELLTQQEITAMLQTCHHVRDKAILSGLYESGCRIGEYLSRSIKHVVFDQYGAVLVIDGKTGMRRIRLIQSVPLLANWIENHPLKDNPDAPLWTSLQSRRTRITYTAVVEVLRQAAREAGVKKAIYSHLFRHTRATELAKHLTEQQLKVYMGWTNSSDMAAVYVHLSGKDVDDAILNIYANVPKPEQEKPTVTKCARCTMLNHFSAKYCNRCGAVLDIRELSNNVVT